MNDETTDRQQLHDYAAYSRSCVSITQTNAMALDIDLMRRYDCRGPRYTSYPTALQFDIGFGEEAYREVIRDSNNDLVPRDLSLYVHLPFCRSACWYCACHRAITQRSERRTRYMQRLFDEIRLQARMFDSDRQVCQLHLGGGTPTAYTTDELAALVNAINDSFPLAPACDREYAIEIDPRTITPADARELASIGFNRFSLGIQDFDAAVQDAINRRSDPDMVAGIVAAARDAGIQSISFDLIYGLPRQTPENFRRTLEKVVEIAPDRLSIYAYAHMPNRFPIQRLIPESDLPALEDRLALFATAADVLADAGYEHIGMDHFALPTDALVQARDEGSLQRNFQGYSTHRECDLVGLGASAVGRIGDSFAQNTVKIQRWENDIGAGHLSIARGLSLNNDDRVRRDVIHSIMCAGRVAIARIETSYDIDFWSYFQNALPEIERMAVDGVLTVGDRTLRVTPAGRFLLRAIAMQFDAYNGSESQSRFSRVL